MDFIDTLKQFSLRVEKLKDSIQTEEATKMSLIVPFFQMLGYDVFNPDEFMPEFNADVGIKKGEKVDYAIMNNGHPVILIEAKWCGDNLSSHSSQLFRYFGTTKAKFGILTNGLIYKFYTDLDETNKMDLTPFLEFDILNIKDNVVSEIKKFNKDNFDVDNIFSTASELKYSKVIKELFSNELKNPSENFVRFILSEIYNGVKTSNVVEKFKGIIKKSLNDYISELMSDKITSALKTENSTNIETEEPQNDIIPEQNKIDTTVEELEAFFIVKTMLSEVVPKEKITYKDVERYFGILFDNNSRKWICRLSLDGNKKHLVVPNEDKSSAKYEINSVDDIYNFKEIITDVVKRYIA